MCRLDLSGRDGIGDWKSRSDARGPDGSTFVHALQVALLAGFSIVHAGHAASKAKLASQDWSKGDGQDAGCVARFKV